MVRPWCHCCRRRTSSGSATATPAQHRRYGRLRAAAVAARRRLREIVSGIVEPVAAELVKRGSAFCGLLYVGLAITAKGPAVVEFNCRFGDPETQAVLALLDSPLGQLLHAAGAGKLADFGELRWRDGAAVTVVLAAENYPGRPRVGDVIVGSEADGVLHAGTSPPRRRRDRLFGWPGAVGGRAPAPTCSRRARARVPDLSSIRLPGSHFRSDIGLLAQEGKIRL